MKVFKRILSLLFVITIILSCTVTAFAHSGRTDSSGGHKDNKNKSGLGSYHYHCGGYPAHLHTNGYCPYTDVFPSSVTITAEKTILGIGEKVSISAFVYPANSCNTNVTWKCSDTNVISLRNGIIEAVGYGTASITAESFNGKIGSIKFTVKEITAEKVSISGTPEPKEYYIGDSFQLNATISPSNVDDPTLHWESTDPSIASVSNIGNVELLSAGNVTVSATASNGVAGKVSINVKERYVEAVTIDHDSLVLFLEDEHIAQATITPKNATFPEITWASSNPEIATVSPEGKITALACGETVITATSTNGLSDRMLVLVSEIIADSVSIVGETVLYLGNEIQLDVQFSPANTSIQDVSWSTVDTNIISISEKGLITGITAGCATVRVHHKDVEAEIQIDVKPINVEEIRISNDMKYTIQTGESICFSANVLPANATYSEITWSTSDSSIASIDEGGVLTAHRSGSVKVIASAADGFSVEYELKISSPVGGTIAIVGLAGAGTAFVLIKKKRKGK